ncbi:integrase catalytic domain-containing protein [Trichonephila clavipes]|nr:integrase catalytic domain-containing protein [Trichonephila clavipes]
MESPTGRPVVNNLQTTVRQIYTREVTLTTLWVRIAGIKWHKNVTVLLDCGSQWSYISELLAAELRLPIVSKKNVVLTLFGGSRTERKLRNKYRNLIFGDIPRVFKSSILKDLDMGADCSKIGILIGSDNYGKILTGQPERLRHRNFLRCENNEDNLVSFVAARLRVAPLKGITIPRLELMARVLGVRLSKYVTQSLTLDGIPKYFWTDFTTAVSWIRSNDTWGTFSLGWVRIFTKNCQKKVVNKESLLTVDEVQDCRGTLLLLIQKESFPETGESINGFLTIQDQSGLRRAKTTIGARCTIRSVIKQCIRRKRFSAKPLATAPIKLPLDRVRDAFAFEVTGVDLCSPLILKTRRGRPSIVYSDNESNFVGASAELKKVDWEKVVSQETLNSITWKFISPTAAWWVGWWERLVRSVKNLILRVLDQASVNSEALLSILCDIEGVINCRPFSYISHESEDLLPLTPSMFLQGIRVSGTADLDILDRNKLLVHQRFCKEPRKQMRSRFRREYLGQLIQSHG